MPRFLPAFALSLAVLPLALPAAADSFSGTVDGAPRNWHVLEVDGVPSAGFHGGWMTQVEIFGFPQADDSGDVTGALELSLSLMNETVSGVSVVYYAGGTRQLYTTDDEDAVRVTLTEVRDEGETLHLRGSLEAELYRMKSLFSEELDHDDSRLVVARFALTLPQR